jgi:hypothetical protein
MRLYLRSDRAISNGQTKNSLKVLLIEAAIEFKGAKFSNVIEFVSKNEDQDKLELLFETMV